MAAKYSPKMANTKKRKIFEKAFVMNYYLSSSAKVRQKFFMYVLETNKVSDIEINTKYQRFSTLEEIPMIQVYVPQNIQRILFDIESYRRHIYSIFLL